MATQVTTVHQQALDRRPLLNRAVRANCIFSGVSGLTFIVFAPALAQTIGIDGVKVLGGLTGVPFIYFIGLGLLGFAGLLFWLSRAERIGTVMAVDIIALDLAWVALSWWVILGRVWPLTTTGMVIVGLLADIVLIFAIVQGVGLRRRLRS